MAVAVLIGILTGAALAYVSYSLGCILGDLLAALQEWAARR